MCSTARCKYATGVSRFIEDVFGVRSVQEINTLEAMVSTWGSWIPEAPYCRFRQKKVKKFLFLRSVEQRRAIDEEAEGTNWARRGIFRTVRK